MMKIEGISLVSYYEKHQFKQSVDPFSSQSITHRNDGNININE